LPQLDYDLIAIEQTNLPRGNPSQDRLSTPKQSGKPSAELVLLDQGYLKISALELPIAFQKDSAIAAHGVNRGIGPSEEDIRSIEKPRVNLVPIPMPYPKLMARDE
jgi:hypothetical protein